MKTGNAENTVRLIVGITAGLLVLAAESASATCVNDCGISGCECTEECEPDTPPKCNPECSDYDPCDAECEAYGTYDPCNDSCSTACSEICPASQEDECCGGGDGCGGGGGGAGGGGPGGGGGVNPEPMAGAGTEGGDSGSCDSSPGGGSGGGPGGPGGGGRTGACKGAWGTWPECGSGPEPPHTGPCGPEPCERARSAGASFGNASVSIKFSLGQATDGASAGVLWMVAVKPVDDIAQPSILHYNYDRADVDVIPHQTTDDIQQIKTPQILVDVEWDSEVDYAFTLRFYDSANWGTFSGGLWQPTAGNEYAKYEFTTDSGVDKGKKLWVDETLGGTLKRKYYYEWQATTEGWLLQISDAADTLLREVETETSYPAAQTKQVTYEVREPVGAGTEVVYQSIKTYYEYAFGWRLTKVEVGASGSYRTTTRTYWNDPQEGDQNLDHNTYKRLKSIRRPDGSWSVYDYDGDGRKITELSSWKDEDMPNPPDPRNATNQSAARTTLYDYTTYISPDDGSVESDKPRVITEKIKGYTVAVTRYQYYQDASANKVVNVERCSDSACTGNKLTTIYVYNDDVDPERLLSVTYPDGRKDTYDYAAVTYTASDSGGHPTIGSYQATGDDVKVEVIHEGYNGSTNVKVAYKSTKDVIIRDAAGNVLQNQTHVWDGSAWQALGWTVHRYDDRGRRAKTSRNNNAHSVTTWSDCCGATSVVDATGAETTYTYDDLGRLETAVKEDVAAYGSYPAQADITFTTAYSANTTGLIKTVTRTGGSLSLVSKSEYDTAGWLKKYTDQSGLATTYAYTKDGTTDGDIVTITYPGSGITEIREHYRDGRLKTVTGTAVVHAYTEYGVNTDGTQWVKRYTGHTSGGSVTGSPQWVKTTMNLLGQVTKTERPGYNSTTVTTTHTYNSVGRLTKTTTTGTADTLYVYDDMGNVTRSGLDVGGTSGTLDLGGVDRISESETKYDNDGTDWWRMTTSKVYPDDNTSDTITTSTAKRRVTGFGSGEMGETVSTDVRGQTTTTTVTVDRTNALVTTTIDRPDSTNDAVEISRNGLAQSSESTSGAVTTYGHDDLGRPKTTVDPRAGTTTRAYYSDTASAGSRGKLHKVTDADSNITTYGYETATGRLASIQYPNNDYQYYDYNKRGERTNEWGANAYPVQYLFDDFGRRCQMSTYQGGSGWDQSTWPASPGTADVTVWVYENATGLLTEKRHADYDALSGGPKWVYTYTTEGKLYTRTWARVDASSNAIVTTYGYDSGTGEMTSVTYTDGTPNVTITYDRAGRQKTIADVVGTRTFAYRDSSPEDMQLATETIAAGAGGLYSKTITRDYAASGDAVGRSVGFQVGTTGDPDADIEVDYAYDATTGRLNGVTGPGLSTNGVAYTWHADSDLVKETLFKDGAGATKASAYRNYETNRDLIDYVENKAESALTTISKYDYVNDAMGRRIGVETSGTAFSSTTEFNQWGYNFRSELTSSKRYTGTYTATPDPGDEITAEKRLYAYDNIGNRDEATEATTTREYTANNLNQYTALTNPSESFDHDEDGNLIADGTFDYTWDAENRLVAVQTRLDLGSDPDNPDNADKLIEFKYDYMGRRVEKRARTYSNGAWVDYNNGRYRFVYDQWNVVLVLDANQSNEVERKYTWGLDLSGQSGDASVSGIHGAGGIGGLLGGVDVEQTASGWFFYDANGNVTQLVQNTTGYPVIAHYEYDPYGNVITSSGVYADINPIRFSTKWFDAETGLGYWGYRYYSPRLGRWMSRDPAQELGGNALYRYARNSAPNAFDPQGLAALWCLSTLPSTPPDEDCYYCGLGKLLVDACYEIDQITTPLGGLSRPNAGCASGWEFCQRTLFQQMRQYYNCGTRECTLRRNAPPKCEGLPKTYRYAPPGACWPGRQSLDAPTIVYQCICTPGCVV